MMCAEQSLPGSARGKGRSAGNRGRALVVALAAGVPLSAAALLGVSYVVHAVLPPVPVPSENPITEPKRVLGKILFWDEQLSTSNVVSCATCHMPSRGGADPRIARNRGIDGILNTPDDILGSPGVIRSDANNDYQRDPVFVLAPQITGRAANSMINAAFSPRLFWDGRAQGPVLDPQTGQTIVAIGGALEAQALAPITNSVEMAHADVQWDDVTQKLRRVAPLHLATNLPPDVAGALANGETYADLFADAFGDPAITPARIALAIATYQRTLISNQTPFDAFRAGVPNAMTPQQVQGFQAFQTSNCAVCHSPAQDLFTDHTFRNIGLRPIIEDNGRQGVTGNPGDRGRFKVPGLRNVGLRRTFMHNGQFQTLTDVIRFYARAPGAPQQFPDNRDPIMPAVNVPPQAAVVIEDFLRNALTDPRVANAQFPFDHPTLFADRPGVQGTILGGGQSGSGGFVPQIIVQAPPVLGSEDYRVGLNASLGGATARLALSTNPPVNGRIEAQRFLGEVTSQGVGAGNGIATLHAVLSTDIAQPGQVLFAQWFVDDPSGAGGVALSAVARIPVFCGRGGCPCDSVDFNRDGVFPDEGDITDFLATLGGAPCASCNDVDFNNDGVFPDDADLASFLRVLGGGTCS